MNRYRTPMILALWLTMPLAAACERAGGQTSDGGDGGGDAGLDGGDSGRDAGSDGAPDHWVVGEPGDERPVARQDVQIDGLGTFTFEPQLVETTRPDLFRPGFFSLFDVLVHLAERGDIMLDYSFAPELDTQVIDDLDGSADWWYQVYYDAGWSEASVHRMDYYPVKDSMHIAFERVDRSDVEQRQANWRSEVARRAGNGGRIVIPEVTLRGPTGASRTFRDVHVTPHDLRSDMLVPGTITAADIIMSLGDEEQLVYGIAWWERIGVARIGNYFIEQIDDDIASGGCGFVYEVGELDDPLGNHIHVAPDMRVLQSPAYGLYYWIELGRC